MTQSDDPKRVTGLTGTVVRAPFGAGSKSAGQAYWLETGNERLVLRRKGDEGPLDKGLAQLVGSQVSCDGFVLDYLLLAEKIEKLK